MCGRYFISEETEKDIRRIAARLDLDIDWSAKGDIYPSQKAAVLSAMPGGGGLYASDMGWGFPMAGNPRAGDQGERKAAGGRLLINARAETALQKPLFSASVLGRRIAIPAAGFYEWDKAGDKVSFFMPEQATIYLAGFYQIFGTDPRFVILTRAANECMAPVHDRMPLILPENRIIDWILPDSQPEKLLGEAVTEMSFEKSE